MDVTYKQVDDFFEEILNSSTPRVKKIKFYQRYQAYMDKENAYAEIEREIKLLLNTNNTWTYAVKGVISDIAIIECYSRNKFQGYIGCEISPDTLGFIKLLTPLGETYDDTEETYIICLIAKYGKDYDALKYIYKLIGK